MIINSNDSERRTALMVADLLAAAARTAPKACGDDAIEVIILTDEEKSKLTKEMVRIADETGAEFFRRDGNNIDNSHCLVLIGVKNVPLGLENCGLCGFENCKESTKKGAHCSFKIVDLGISIGSAVSICADHRIDNRVMFSAGRAAIKLGMFSKAVTNCYGIPLSTMGKSNFFDRAEQTGILVTAKK